MNHDLAGLSAIRQTADISMGLSRPSASGGQGRQAEMAALNSAAKEFESYFISNLLKVMRETVPKGALDNKGGAYFYSFYDQEIGRLSAEAGGLGLARMIHEYTEKNASSPSSPAAHQPIEEPTGSKVPLSASPT
ncbi:MAG: rod-binding protein [Nitrospirae bacterium]|nr:rod-binding protein [Nitrospirota bacterium]